MASEKQHILQWFYWHTFPSGILQFDTFLRQAIIDSLGKSPLDVDDYLYANVKRMWNALLQSIDIENAHGRIPAFRIVDSLTRRFSWTAKERPIDVAAELLQLRIGLETRPHFLREVQFISSRQYEALGCVACELIGAIHVKLTPPGNEGGIDFFALIEMPFWNHIFTGSHRPLRIIGQSKKFGERVQVDKIKEFIQTLEEVKNLNPSVEPHVPPWFRAASGPIVGWLIAHNGVQSGGESKAKNHGIIISDSIDLAEIVALSRKIDFYLPPNTRATTALSMAKAYLN